MTISMSQITELRQMTQCGVMDCKKALEEAGGDRDKAVEILRKKGMAKAVSKAGRLASDGVIAIRQDDRTQQAVMVEINCETDFVARDALFQNFVQHVLEVALTQRMTTVEALSRAVDKEGNSIEALREELVAKVGENITIRRIVCLATPNLLGSYVHGVRIGVLIELIGGDSSLAKELAMHIAAAKPLVVSPDQLDADVLAKEKEIYREQSLQSGKPANIVEKMVEGRMKKFADEVSLIGQPFIKDPKFSVEQILKERHVQVVRFVRYELGEGLGK